MAVKLMCEWTGWAEVRCAVGLKRLCEMKSPVFMRRVVDAANLLILSFLHSRFLEVVCK